MIGSRSKELGYICLENFNSPLTPSGPLKTAKMPKYWEEYQNVAHFCTIFFKSTVGFSLICLSSYLKMLKYIDS